MDSTQTADYIIEACGAGGGDEGTITPKYLGGKGAKITGTFSLTQGDIILIGVGQKGSKETIYSHRPGGGGGATYVVKHDAYDTTWTRQNGTRLIIAGGGGHHNNTRR